MQAQTSHRRVLQMRLVVQAADHDEAVGFYRDVLGAPEELVVHGDTGEKVTSLDVGRATFEITPGSLQLTVFQELSQPTVADPR